jgi:hypothetical protein
VWHFGGEATVVLAALLRFNVSWVRGRSAIRHPAGVGRSFGWGGLPARSLAAHPGSRGACKLSRKAADVYEPICLFHAAAGNSGSIEIQNTSEIVACMGCA